MFWVDAVESASDGELSPLPSPPSRLIPRKVVARLQARRQVVSSPTRKKAREDPCDDDDDDEAVVHRPCVPLTRLPEDVARQFFREDGWFEATDLMRLRVSRALRDLVGPRPALLLRHALPAFNAWRSRTKAFPPRRPRRSSFQRSPARWRPNADRAVLLF